MSRSYSIREQFDYDISRLTIWLRLKGYGSTKGEAYRTAAQQEIHRKAGRSKVKVSQHQKRLAEDKHIWNEYNGKTFITDQQWLEVGRYWESLNPRNRWGGRFGVNKKDYNTKVGWDRSHFERRS